MQLHNVQLPSCSSKHNSVVVTSRAVGGTFREPRFDNVHGIGTLVMCRSGVFHHNFSAVATFCVVAANKNKAQERLLELKRKIG